MFLVPLGFVVWDVAHLLLVRPRWSPSGIDIAAFMLGSWGLGASLAACVLGLRACARAAFARAAQREAIFGAIDGAAFGALAAFFVSPGWLGGTATRAFAIVLVAIVGSALGSVLHGSLRQLFRASVFLCSGYFLSTLAPHADAWLRATLQTTMLVAAASSLSGQVLKSKVFLALIALAIGLASLMATSLQHAPGARSALALHSVHARVWVALVERFADRDHDQATTLFGGHDCDPNRADVHPAATELLDNGRDENCDGRDGIPADAPAPRSSAHGVAKGRDVLVISIDSLRFDVADELTKTRAVLGAHADLTRSVSPTPKTVTSIASVLRGRPFRQIDYAPVPGVRNPVPKGSVTLGDVLAKAGYRTMTVPTHPYLAQQGGVLSGFDQLLPSASELAERFVRAPSAIELVTSEISRSPNPVCAFIHLMESHHPFRYGNERGPDSLVGLRRAVRYLDPLIADMIARVSKMRGAPPIVAILGDHGEEFGEHGGRFHATTVYSEQVRVAFLLSAPGVPSGELAAPISTATLPATVLDLIGIDPPASMTVPSILAYLTNDSAAPDVAVSEVRGSPSSVGYTFEFHRLIVDPVRSVQMLFDNRVDVLEASDRADDSPGVLRDLAARARDWNERH